MKTALYFDLVNLASKIKAPFTAGIGFIDKTSPAVGIWTTSNQISGPTEAQPLPTGIPSYGASGCQVGALAGVVRFFQLKGPKQSIAEEENVFAHRLLGELAVALF